MECPNAYSLTVFTCPKPVETIDDAELDKFCAVYALRPLIEMETQIDSIIRNFGSACRVSKVEMKAVKEENEKLKAENVLLKNGLSLNYGLPWKRIKLRRKKDSDKSYLVIKHVKEM